MLVARPLVAQHDHAQHNPSDSAFAATQARGRNVMGVDQYASKHVFEPLADGGRIELQRDTSDQTDIRTIRVHLSEIARAFSRGDFNAPFLVHAQDVPGTAVMKARRSAIRYRMNELPRGGEVRITTRDPEAIAAVHDFLAFQRQEHRAGEH